jgi:hypothetical protein
MPLVKPQVANARQITVEPVSKAARVLLYDAAGNPLLADNGALRTITYDSDGYEARPIMRGGYMLPVIHQRLSAALVAGATIWTMRNGTNYLISIRRIFLALGFSGTAAATTSSYQLYRFSGATPTGGIGLTVVKRSSSYPSTSVIDARFNYAASLGVAGVVFETAFAACGVQRQVSATQLFDMDYSNVFGGDRINLRLAPNEGLAIKIDNTGVIGDTIGGFVDWNEF